MPIRVLLITKLFPDAYKPFSGRLILNLAKDLNAKEDLEVKVIRPIPYVPKIFSLLSKRFKTYAFHPLSQLIDGLEIYYPKYLKFPGSFTYFEDVFIVKITEKILKSNFEKIDIVYTHWIYPDAVAALKIARKYNAKLIIHFHASGPYIFLRNKRIKKLSQVVLEKSDMTIFVSQGIMNDTLNLFTVNNPTVIYNGIDDNLFFYRHFYEARKALKVNKNIIMLLSVGYLKQNKGFDLAINAIAKLNIDNLHYYIVGWGDELNNLKKLAESLNLNERVHFVGAKKYEEINSWMQAADVLVQPSRIESFGQVFVEALMCGTPVIGTKVGGIPEIVKDGYNGYLINIDDVGSLALAIEKTLRTKWNIDDLINSVSHFSFSNMSNYIAELLLKDPASIKGSKNETNKI